MSLQAVPLPERPPTSTSSIERRRPSSDAAVDTQGMGRLAHAWGAIDRALATPSSIRRFEPELEARFETDTFPERLQVLVRAMQWTPPAIGIFLFCDQFMVPDVWALAVILRLVALAPYSLVFHLFRDALSSARLLDLTGVFGVVSMAVVHLFIVSQSKSELALLYLAATAMISMYGAAFLRLRFLPALVAMSLIFVGTVLTYLGMAAHAQSHVVGVPVLWLVLSASVFSLYALFHLEKEERRNYLMSLKQTMIREDLQRTIGQVESMARVDPLTQITNRRHFNQQLERLWSRLQIAGDPVSLMLIDIDDFSRFAQQHGARRSDVCLHALAQAIQGCLRRPNDLVARSGDDQFVVILSHTCSEPAHTVAHRILVSARTLCWPCEPGKPLGTRVSIGVASLHQVSDFDSAEALETMARHAVVSAQKQGGDRMVQSWSERPVA